MSGYTAGNLCARTCEIDSPKTVKRCRKIAVRCDDCAEEIIPVVARMIGGASIMLAGFPIVRFSSRRRRSSKLREKPVAMKRRAAGFTRISLLVVIAAVPGMLMLSIDGENLRESNGLVDFVGRADCGAQRDDTFVRTTLHEGCCDGGNVIHADVDASEGDRKSVNPQGSCPVTIGGRGA